MAEKQLLNRAFAGGGVGQPPAWYNQSQQDSMGTLNALIKDPFTSYGQTNPYGANGAGGLSGWSTGAIAPTLQGLYSQPWQVSGNKYYADQALSLFSDQAKNPW